MNPYLRWSMICFAGAGIALWLFIIVATGGARTGGTMSWWTWKEPVSIEGICKHRATFAAYTFGEKYPVRIAIGIRKLNGKMGTHVQAQAMIDDKWQWLVVKYPFVQVGEMDSGFQNIIFKTFKTWLEVYVMDTVIKENKE